MAQLVAGFNKSVADGKRTLYAQAKLPDPSRCPAEATFLSLKDLENAALHGLGSLLCAVRPEKLKDMLLSLPEFPFGKSQTPRLGCECSIRRLRHDRWTRSTKSQQKPWLTRVLLFSLFLLDCALVFSEVQLFPNRRHVAVFSSASFQAGMKKFLSKKKEKGRK
eukprot:6213785-Pleurochrysis_carterae.AAC.2